MYRALILIVCVCLGCGRSAPPTNKTEDVETAKPQEKQATAQPPQPVQALFQVKPAPKPKQQVDSFDLDQDFAVNPAAAQLKYSGVWEVGGCVEAIANNPPRIVIDGSKPWRKIVCSVPLKDAASVHKNDGVIIKGTVSADGKSILNATVVSVQKGQPDLDPLDVLRKTSDDVLKDAKPFRGIDKLKE